MNDKETYVIRMHGQLISVSEDVYYTFYKFKRYELNLEEKDSRNQKVLF